MIIFWSFLAVALVSVSGHKFHDFISDEEVEKLFNVPRELVPEYDIVKIEHGNIQKRSLNTAMKFKAFDQEHLLDFELNDSFLMHKNTPLYLASNYGAGDHFSMAKYDINMVAYQDIKNEAAIVTTVNENGNLEVHGTIGDSMYIKPMRSFMKKLKPDTISRIHKMSKRSINNFNRIFDEENHIVLKYKNKFNKQFCLVEEPEGLNFTSSEEPKAEMYQTADSSTVQTVYPQILVTLDYLLYKQHNFDNSELMKYVYALYNAVDLKFRLLKDPQVRLNIASVVVAKDEKALTYFDNAIDKSSINSQKTLSSMSKYFWKNSIFTRNNPDVKIAMTGKNMMSLAQDGSYRGSVVGLAFVGTVCKHDSGNADLSVALVEDYGDFFSVNTVAHELGHVLGSPHDEGKCLGNYVMHPVATRGTERTWSRCSEDAFHNTLLHPHAACVLNKPKMREPLPIVFPGQVIESLDKQCDMIHHDSFAIIDNDPVSFPCEQLMCQMKYDNRQMRDTGGAFDGTPCMNNMGVCLQGKCVVSNIL